VDVVELGLVVGVVVCDVFVLISCSMLVLLLICWWCIDFVWFVVIEVLVVMWLGCLLCLCVFVWFFVVFLFVVWFEVLVILVVG